MHTLQHLAVGKQAFLDGAHLIKLYVTPSMVMTCGSPDARTGNRWLQHSDTPVHPALHTTMGRPSTGLNAQQKCDVGVTEPHTFTQDGVSQHSPCVSGLHSPLPTAPNDPVLSELDSLKEPHIDSIFSKSLLVQAWSDPSPRATHERGLGPQS